MSNDSHPSDTDTNWSPSCPDPPVVQTAHDRLTNRAFTEWYTEQQIEENILNGQAYFNGPSPPKDPEQYTPSELLQCHRKAMYERRNAPSEGTPPEGLFWIGSEFEEQIIVPFLQDVVTTEETYVQNSVWIDTELTVDDTTVCIRGSTDPVVVTADADPLFVTEIKTTKDIEHLSGPKLHHKAQLHAYLYALNQDYDHTIQDGMIVYGSRTTFDIETFPVEFDPVFWADVKEWLVTQAEYEQADALPPATPERDWECSYCSYKHRCGKAESPYNDVEPEGLLPLFNEYDKQPLITYLDAHQDEGAQLTPTLAHEFPELTETYDVYPWQCPRCETTFEWTEVEWDGVVSNPPVCPVCLETKEFITLSGPDPGDQLGD